MTVQYLLTEEQLRTALARAQRLPPTCSAISMQVSEIVKSAAKAPTDRGIEALEAIAENTAAILRAVHTLSPACTPESEKP